MHKTRLDFLKRYMATICPTGYEEEASRVWREEADKFADRTWVDQHGNSFAVVNEKGSPRIMLAGHADEIGLMVTHIDDKGYLFFTGLGGWDVQVLPGQRVRIVTAKGIVLGIIGRKPIHMMSPDDRKKVVKMEDLWIDIGAADRKAAEKLVTIGDPAVLDYDFAELRDGLATARGFDDRIGAFVVLEAARLAVKMKPKAAIYAVATVQEEIGVRGATTSAYGIDPQVGIAVDVGHATDMPDMSTERKRSGRVTLGGGPIVTRGPNVNTPLFERIVKTAKAKQVPIQLHAYPRPTGTDARAIQITRAGVATGLIGVPSRYMHSPSEVVHLDDVENCSKLIAETIAGIGPKTSFLPS